MTGDGPLRIDVPRDRDGSFKPLPIAKHERRFIGFDERIVTMYARGKSLREIRPSWPSSTPPRFARVHQQRDRCRHGEVGVWQAQPLELMYPVVFLDTLRAKIRGDAVVRNKTIFLARACCPATRVTSWAVGGEHRTREVLDEGVQRSEHTRRAGHSDCHD